MHIPNQQLPDLPLPHTGAAPLRSRRHALAQIVLCQGCCCGRTERDLPAVPLEWLKPLWKSERLNKTVQLTVSGCLGPCDLPNVACVVTPQGQTWYGRLTTREDYAVLVSWARRCREEQALLPLPSDLDHLRFDRWARPDTADLRPLIEQTPGDLLLLTAADTDLALWSAALDRLPHDFPSVRALHLDRLRDAHVRGAYLDDVVQDCRAVLVRPLGGIGYWRELLDELHVLARSHAIALVVVPGDTHPDAALLPFNTVPLALTDQLWRYCAAGGVANAEGMLQTLALASGGRQPPDWDSDADSQKTRRADAPRSPSNPQPQPELALHIDDPADGRPTAAIAFYRAHALAGNTRPIDALANALRERGFAVRALFGPDLAAILRSDLLGTPDLLITTTHFRAGPDLPWPNVPVLQALLSSSTENVWSANPAGLSPRDLAMTVALPEFDGRVITTAIAFRSTQTFDARLQTPITRHEPRADRIAFVADLAARHVRLRKTPNAEKRIAIVLANYPSKNARVGNAVGLDTPASLHGLLLALRDAGYDLGSPDALPADGQTLIEQVIAASVQDPEHATAEAFLQSPGWAAGDDVRRWLRELPPTAADAITRQWGEPEQSPLWVPERDGFPVPGVQLGNVFISVQPSRGYDLDPSAVYHSPDLPPTPYYLAFYRWLRDIWRTDAIVQLGKHGNLEWLPGKSVALSPGCFPEVILGPVPVVYPFIVNNPGEGTQAKRRSAAVIVDHLIPPMTTADTYGPLRELELLLDEYAQATALDPSKGPRLLERVAEVVAAAGLDADLGCSASDAALLSRLDGYLCEIKEAQIRDGLHILGRLPDGEQLVGLLQALLRNDNGTVPGLPRALAADGATDDEKHLIAEVLASRHPPAGPMTQQTLTFLRESLLPRLKQTPDEIAHIITFLNGRSVPPGPSGAPTRGRADVLPTGRNFYALDVRAVPSPTAWDVGRAAAESLLARHLERTGSYPESVAMVVWGTSNMRTGGDDIAEVLALLGVRPLWDGANRRVVGLEVVPLAELGRPRIDVTVRISGLFRDAFPHLVRLLNDAIARVAGLDEALDRNFVKANIVRDLARLRHAHDGTFDESEAERRVRYRVFGSKPEAYGAGLLPLIDGRNWQTLDDLAAVYLTWGSYAYTADSVGDEEAVGGVYDEDAFRMRLATTDLVVQNQDNREHDIFDSDDYFQFHGGLIAAARAVSGRTPEAYLGDTSRPEDVRTRTLAEEARRVFRSRVVNPKWLAGVMRHGYKGAAEMAATVDYLFGYDATTEIMDERMYEQLAEAYLFDAPVKEWLGQVNPWALRGMAERMMEAVERGMWPASAEMLEQLREVYAEADTGLETRG